MPSFNVYSLPTIVAMLLFWTLGLYLLSRGWRRPASLAAAATFMALTVWLFGQAMEANGVTPDAWLPRARWFGWGAPVALVGWYWMALLVFRAEAGAAHRRFLRYAGYPVGALIALAGAFFVWAGLYDDWLYDFSHPVATRRTPPPSFESYLAPATGLFGGMMVLAFASTGATAGLFGWLWRRAAEPSTRTRLRWLFAAAALAAVAAAYLSVNSWLHLGWQSWVGHLMLAAALSCVAWNVAAYSALLADERITRDFVHFLAFQAIALLLVTLAFLIVGLPYRLQWLELLLVVLWLTQAGQATVDLARSLLDRAFYPVEVREFRAGLSSLALQAARATDFGAVLSDASAEMARLSEQRFRALVEDALRKLNTPSALADHELAARLPHVVEMAGQTDGGEPPRRPSLTPLEQAAALRGVLVDTIDKLKPPGMAAKELSAGALQYLVLREEYVEGRLNKQIIARHDLSEGSFNRARRQAIAALARELLRLEELVAAAKTDAAATPQPVAVSAGLASAAGP